MADRQWEGVISHAGEIFMYRHDEGGRPWVARLGTEQETAPDAGLAAAIALDVDHQLEKRLAGDA